MTALSIIQIDPSTGPSSGGALVTLRGVSFGPRVRVRFGNADARVVSVREVDGGSVVEVLTPVHAEATVDVTVVNVDAVGAPIAKASATLVTAYRFLRPRIVREADLTRVVRTLLRELKRQVIENVSLSVALDFGDEVSPNADAIPVATLPALVVSGPHVRENRFYSTNELREDVVVGPGGPEVRRVRPPYTVDLEFALTGASDRAVELLNLIAALGTFFNRNHWLAMDRDARDPSLGTVRWELDAVGELQTILDGKDDVRSFTWGLVVRGFDLDEGLAFDTTKAVAALHAAVAGGVP
jgi:hypothetical protein